MSLGNRPPGVGGGTAFPKGGSRTRGGYRCGFLLSVPGALYCQRGRLKRNARAVQLFGRLAVLETHALRY